MADPDLNESAWQRAKHDAERIYKTTTFGVALAIMELLAIPAAVLATVGQGDTATQVTVPILSGALALALAFIFVLVVQLAAAPVRQRDELRRAWKTPEIETVNVDLTLRNTHRRGNELAQHLEARDGVARGHREEIDAWVEEVVALLAAHLPDNAGQQFIAAGQDQKGPVRRLRLRVNALQQIIDGLD